MSDKTNLNKSNARAEKLDALRSSQKRKISPLALLVFGVIFLVLVLVAIVSVLVAGQNREEQQVLQNAQNGIEGVQEFTDLPRQHVSGTVDYPQNPPVGGNHKSVWTNCGVYDVPTVKEQSVHSLEHGAIWITYEPNLDTEQLSRLVEIANGDSYILLSPYEGLPSPIVLSAWGVQLQVDSVEDERIPVFLAKYLQGEQTPEPGAPCFGGSNS